MDAGENEQISFTIMPGTTADLVICAEVENFEMDPISTSGALAAPAEIPSFLSPENEATSQVLFLITADGITIPEEEITEEIVPEKSFAQKLKDLIAGLTD